MIPKIKTPLLARRGVKFIGMIIVRRAVAAFAFSSPHKNH